VSSASTQAEEHWRHASLLTGERLLLSDDDGDENPEIILS